MTTDPRGLAFRSPLSDVSATCLDPASCRKPAAAPRGAWESGAPRQLQERGLVNAGSFLVSPKRAALEGRVDEDGQRQPCPASPAPEGREPVSPEAPRCRGPGRISLFSKLPPRAPQGLT